MKNWSRKTKLTLCTLILLLTVTALFFCSDWPSPTPEIALRRAEKEQLVGPAEIIATLDFQHGTYDHMMIGASENGYTTFEYYDHRGWDDGKLRYFPKTEGATLFCPEYSYYDENSEPYVLIFLFPEKYAAASAEMTLSISCGEESETYYLEGQRQDGNYYIFSLPYRGLKGQFFWLLQQALTGSYSEYVLTGTVDISIEYYDRNGQLTDSYERTITK